MFCFQCGCKLPDNSQFCPQCGVSQQSMAMQQPYAGAVQQQPYVGAAQQSVGGFFEQYRLLIESRLGPGKYVPELCAWMYYSEEFKIKWAASKMKKYVFLANFERLDGFMLQSYSSACMKHALHIYEGLPRGFQNGVASFAIAASDNVMPDAIAYAQQPAPAHFAAFEFSIAADLAKHQIVYMQKTPMWGALMWSDIRKFGSWCASFQ